MPSDLLLLLDALESRVRTGQLDNNEPQDTINLVSQIRETLLDNLRYARDTLRNESEIIKSARLESEEIIKQANKSALEIISKDNIQILESDFMNLHEESALQNSEVILGLANKHCSDELRGLYVQLTEADESISNIHGYITGVLSGPSVKNDSSIAEDRKSELSYKENEEIPLEQYIREQEIDRKIYPGLWVALLLVIGFGTYEGSLLLFHGETLLALAMSLAMSGTVFQIQTTLSLRKQKRNLNKFRIVAGFISWWIVALIIIVSESFISSLLPASGIFVASSACLGTIFMCYMLNLYTSFSTKDIFFVLASFWGIGLVSLGWIYDMANGSSTAITMTAAYLTASMLLLILTILKSYSYKDQTLRS